MDPRLDVLTRFLRLGVTSFGGPVAHLAYFRREFVERAGWIDDAGYAELVALCTALPGPTSSQVGISLGARRAGAAGALLAWLGFTAPSAIALGLFGLAVRRAGDAAGALGAPAVAGALAGLGAAAAAVVLLAVVQLARTLANRRPTAAIAVGAFALALALDRAAPGLQWLALLAGGAAGAFVADAVPLPAASGVTAARGRATAGSLRLAVAAATLLALLLAVLPVVAQPATPLGTFASFFRAGALVFGGGHVVLPFLETIASADGVPQRVFLAGYGAAQAVPGPLFTFATYLGAVDRTASVPLAGALAATAGVFAPSFLLLAMARPLWARLRTAPRAGRALAGLGAAVVGILAAALAGPVAATLARSPLALGTAALAYAALALLRWPAWAVVIACAAAAGAARAVLHV